MPASALPVIPPPVLAWLRQAYASDIAGGTGSGDPDAAAAELPSLRAWLASAAAARPGAAGPAPAGLTADEAAGFADAIACATGDVATVAARLQADPAWCNRAGGALALPPLVAVTHSRLVGHDGFREALRGAARLLLRAGANPDAAVANRGWPASLEAPNPAEPLSALYGAAGRNHDPVLTQALLDAGADPNDGESLYHALEDRECTQRLLAAGARVTGSNAFYRAFDLDDPVLVQMLLDAGADPDEPARNAPLDRFGTPLLWAIHRRRSLAHIEPLLAAGADPSRRTAAGHGALRLAIRQGLDDVAAGLRRHGLDDDATVIDRFLGACARADAAGVQALLAADPGLITRLEADDQRLLPEMAAAGNHDAVALMLTIGWPLEACGGDWDASALNHAIFRGDAAMTETLLAAGARWQTRHGYGGDALGTLSWAATYRPVASGDWVGCAAALRRHGLAAGQRDPERPGWIQVGSGSQPYPADVAAILLDPLDGDANLDPSDGDANLERVRADLAARAPDLRIEIAHTSTATVALAAAAFGVPPAQIAKTLALQVGDRVLLVVASGDRRLDNRKVRGAFGGKGRMLDPARAHAVTGHPVGGVCPFALPADLPVYCDVSLQAFDVVLPAAGSLTSAVRITPARLAALTGERWVDVCQPTAGMD